MQRLQRAADELAAITDEGRGAYTGPGIDGSGDGSEAWYGESIAEAGMLGQEGPIVTGAIAPVEAPSVPRTAELYALEPWRHDAWAAGVYLAVGMYYADAEKAEHVYCELLSSSDYGRTWTRLAPHVPHLALAPPVGRHAIARHEPPVPAEHVGGDGGERRGPPRRGRRARAGGRRGSGGRCAARRARRGRG